MSILPTLLAIDFGNTCTKSATYSNQGWSAISREGNWQALVNNHQGTVVACGSVPAGFSRQVIDQTQLSPSAYQTPETLGTDRIANVLALRAMVKTSAVKGEATIASVDFGTATNIEVIDHNGLFLGGAILPGAITSANALLQNAPALQTAISDFKGEIPKAIGTTSQQNIQIGALLGHAKAVDGLLSAMGVSYAVFTGGLAQIIGPLCQMPHSTEPYLTLNGLRLFAGF